MSWKPIAFLPPQYANSSGAPYSGAVLKAYQDGTNTPISMATDYTGATLTGSMVLNAAGYPTYLGTIVIPHIAEDYKLALYPSQAAADANSGAIWTVDNIKIADTTNTPFLQYFDGDGVTASFNLSEDLGTDETVLMVFADRSLPNYITNGDFASDTIWTKGSGWTIGAGVATAAGAISTPISQNANVPIIQGQSYTVEFTVTASAGTLTPSVGGNAGTTRGAGTWRETIIAGSTQVLAFTGAAFTGTLDNVSVKDIYSNDRLINRADEFTLAGNVLTLNNVPPSGTKNVIVFAPSLLLGAAAASAAAAATSETNAAAHADRAEDAEDGAQAAAALVGSVHGWQYKYDSDTAATDPTAGKLKFNNATLASATELYISETTNATQAIAASLNAWDDSTSTVRGSVRMFKQSAPATFATFNITGTRTDNGAWDTFTVAYVDGSGSFTDEDNVILEFTRTGDKGDAGATVATGATGATGVGAKFGLGTSNNATDANNDIDVAAGFVVSSDGLEQMTLASAITKRLDASWAVGTNQGGLDTGSKANSTWYHVHLIKRVDTGVVDVLFSTSATAPTLPANYTKSRRIGSVQTDGSGNIRGFVQTGDMFEWKTMRFDYNGVVISTTSSLRVVSAPLGVSTQAWMRVDSGDGSDRNVLISSPLKTDETSDINKCNLIASSGGRTINEIFVVTNTASEVRMVANTSTVAVNVHTKGWRELWA